MRLAAYSGVLAARVAHEQQESKPGGAAQVSSGKSTDDPNLLRKLSSEGWLEHNIVEGG